MSDITMVTAGDALYLQATLKTCNQLVDLSNATIEAGVKNNADNVLIPLFAQDLTNPDNDLLNGSVIIQFPRAASISIPKGQYIIVIVVTIAGNPSTFEAPLRFQTGMPPAAAPAISSSLTATATVGQPFSYQITASNNPLAYQALDLPAGLALNPLTGLISGTPTTAGVSTVALTAANFTGLGAANLALTIGS